MRSYICILAMMLVCGGCDNSRHTTQQARGAQPSTKPSAVVAQATVPAPVIATRAVATHKATTAGADMAHAQVSNVCDASKESTGSLAGAVAGTPASNVFEAAPDIAVTNPVETSVAMTQTSAQPAPVFDLATADISDEALTAAGVATEGISELRILDFSSNSTEIAVQTESLPDGNRARTLLILVKKDATTEGVGFQPILLYGKPGQIGKAFGMGIHHGRVFFWGYGIDLYGEGVVPIGQWVSLAATYDGERIVLYNDGIAVHESQANIDTVKTALSIGGNGFVGKVGIVKVWDIALSPADLADIIAKQMSVLTTAQQLK